MQKLQNEKTWYRKNLIDRDTQESAINSTNKMAHWYTVVGVENKVQKSITLSHPWRYVS